MNLRGKRLGSWVVNERLGSGGQGSVWLATKQDINGTILKAAIKTLGEDGLKSSTQRQLLAHEYEMIRSIKSPYLAKYLDSGVETIGEKNLPLQWLALEYIPGSSLAEEIKQEGILDEARWLELAHDTLSALAEMHSMGVIHSDVKPANIMRSSRKSMLVDLGGASLVGIRDAGDTSGGILTHAYAAPEQLDGAVNAKDYGYEIDIFALGMTLVFAGTGVAPWDEVINGPTNVRRQSVKEHYLAIRDNPPRLTGLSQKQKDLVVQMLNFDPSKRVPAATLLTQVKALLPEGSSRRTEASAAEPVRWVPQNSANSSPNSSYSTVNVDDSQPKWTATVILLIFGYGIGQVLRLMHFNAIEAWKFPRRRVEYILIAFASIVITLGIAGIFQAKNWVRLGATQKMITVSWIGAIAGFLYIGVGIVAAILLPVYETAGSVLLAVALLAALPYFPIAFYLAIPPRQALKS